MKKISMLLMVLMMVSAACLATSPADARAESSTVVALTDPAMAHELFTKAINERNLEQLCAMYADDAVMMLRDGKTTVSGKENIRKLFSKMVAVTRELTLETVYYVKAEDTALFRSKYRSVFTTPQGKRVEVISSGIEILKRNQDGTWQFVIDHHGGGQDIF